MIDLYAPHPDYRIKITLPSPEWGDTQRLESTMQLKKSMDGTVTVTHVRKLQNIRSYELSFALTRLKSLELIEFYSRFGAQKIKLVSFGTDKIGYLRINPFELEIVRRSLVASSIEEVAFKIDFETII